MEKVQWETSRDNGGLVTARGPWGQYVVRRERKKGHTFCAYLNGRVTKYRGKRAEVMEAIEARIKAMYWG